MILTIGMIVKNEEKYLEACLNGIKPILEQVDSELIIADTGSTDRTVEIARKFTDNVFYFEWIKDFAAARNSTLEKAQGEWFMFVDADEIFESCDEIIHFFNSGEYKKYNSASYIQRNLLKSLTSDEPDINNYSDFRAPRMTKILPETKFVKPIHEQLTTYGRPLKILDDHVIHYGYAYAIKTEESKDKYIRNTELLLKELEENGENIITYLQLYESMAKHEPQKADEYLDKGIELGVKTKSNITPVLYGKKAASLHGDRKYTKLIELGEEYFKLDKNIRPNIIGTDAEIVCGQALAHYELGHHKESIPFFKKYFQLYKDYTNGTLATPDTFLTSRDFCRQGNFLPILQKFVTACINCNCYDTATDYLTKLPIDKYSEIPAQIFELVRVEISVLEHYNYKNIRKYYTRFGKTGKNMLKNALLTKMFVVSDSENILDFFENEESCEEFRDPARRAYSIVTRRRAGDYKNCIAEMRQLIEAYPSLSSVISAYQKEVIAEYENSKPQNEMQQLATMIKSNIRNFISSGNLPAAEKTLSEYEKINPNDPDIAELKAQIQ